MSDAEECLAALTAKINDLVARWTDSGLDDIAPELANELRAILSVEGDRETGCPDCGGKEECGGGFHFCASPFEAKQFQNTATRFVACPVRLTDMAVHADASMPQKVKAKGLAAKCWEVNIDGETV